MVVLSAKYIYLITFILIQLFTYNSAENIRCITCGGANAPCSVNLSENPKECSKEAKNCYTKIDTNGDIERGCIEPDNKETCTTDNNCVSTDDGKNDQIVCKKCDGSDKDCSQTDVNDKKYNKICDAGIKKCFKKVDQKLVVRGCASDSDNNKNSTTYNVCDLINCNAGIFPENRLKCYQCQNSNCDDVTASKLVSIPCEKYEENDECYTKGENDKTMIRGCKSDNNNNTCSSVAKGCAFCNESNCNNLHYKRKPELMCHQCTGNATNNQDCFKQQNNATLKSCEKELLYNETDYCYTQFEDGIVDRGCFYDNANLISDKCIVGDSEANVCNKCNDSNGCNNKNIILNCVVCRSDIDEKCWNKADQISTKGCRNNNTSPAEGCFHGIWNGVAIRGCFADLTEQNQSICKDPKNNQCEICYNNNCNTKQSLGVKILPSSLMLFVLTALWTFK